MAALTGTKVEILLGGTTWTDITSRVMVRDSGGKISGRRGQTSEGSSPDPGSLTFQLNNRDGLFSIRNAVSPYYGLIGLNTQIRFSVTKSDASISYRFSGVVPSWPENWDTTGKDIWVDVTAAGPLRRLRQGLAPLRSTMYRGLTGPAAVAVQAYWPMEDASESTFIASALTGGRFMTWIGSPNLSSDTEFDCSEALPAMNGGTFLGQVEPYASTGQTQVRFLLSVPTALPDKTQVIKCQASGASVSYWAVTYGTGGTLSIKGLDSDGLTEIVTTGAISFGVVGHPMRISMELTQSGSAVTWTLGSVDAVTAVNSQITGTFASSTAGTIRAVHIFPGQTATDTVVGHLSVQSQVTSAFDLAGQVVAFAGETAAGRFARLCTEQGITASVFAGETDLMGPQRPAVFMDLLQECQTVDQGIMFEKENGLGLAYRPRTSLYNAAAAATISYSGHQPSQVPQAIPDDQLIRNSWTVNRPQGTSVPYAALTGTRSILDPPLGVSEYGSSQEVNVYQDGQLLGQASWRVYLGTVDAPRYAAIVVELARPSISTAQRDALLGVLFGHRLTITGLPSRVGGAEQMVIGIQEDVSKFLHTLTFICQPYDPYLVGTLDGGAADKPDSGGTTLHSAVTSTATSFTVDVAGTTLWTTSAGDMPLLMTVAGEQISVGAVSGTSSPQTFSSVTRSVNGVVKAQAAGAALALTRPLITPL